MSENEIIEETNIGYNHEYELLEQEKVTWVGDGHNNNNFIDQSWVCNSLGDTDAKPVQPAKTDQVCILSTWLRYQDGELKGESYAHDRHPFVFFLHLLHQAKKNSTVFLSMPFLSDFDAIDQLCHYADPRNAGLKINIILGPAFSNISNLESFVGRSQTREEAVARLHIKRFGRDDLHSAKTTSYSHSKAMISTAGGIIGSYNYTVASRKRHYETGTFIPPDHEDYQGLKTELELLWDSLDAQSEIQIHRMPLRNAAPRPGTVFNPYSKRHKK